MIRRTLARSGRRRRLLASMTAVATCATTSIATLASGQGGGNSIVPLVESSADGVPKSWDVTAPKGKSKTIDFVTSEATWLSVDVAPDGRQLVFDLVGQIWLLPIDGGTAKKISEGTGIALNYHPQFSPDGKQIAFISDRDGQENIWIMDADGDNPRQVSSQRTDRMAFPTWTPDGQQIVVRRGGDSNNTLTRGDQVSGRGELWIYDIEDGKGEQLTPGDVAATWPSVSPDGRHIYYEEILRGPRPNYVWNTVIDVEDPVKGRNQLRRLDRRTGEVLNITGGELFGRVEAHPSSGGAAAPEIAPDGYRLAFMRPVADGTAIYKGHEYSPRTALWLRDLQSGSERKILDPITPAALGKQDIGAIPRYTWMPDGKSLLVAAGGGLKRVYPDTGEVREVPFTAHVRETISERVYNPIKLHRTTFTPKIIKWPAFSPDKKQVAYQAVGKIWIHDLPSGETRRMTDQTFVGHEYSPAWSPDGKSIVFAAWDDDQAGSLWIVSAQGGPATKLTSQQGEYINPSWSFDGKQIVTVRSSGATQRGRMPDENEWYNIQWCAVDQGRCHLKHITTALPFVGHSIDPTYGPYGRVFYLEGSAGDPFCSVRCVPGTQFVSIRPDGTDKIVHLKFTYTDQVAISPDGKNIAFQDGGNVYLMPFTIQWTGEGVPPHIEKQDPAFFIQKLTHKGGTFPAWIDSGTLSWASANDLVLYDLATGRKTKRTSELKIAKPIASGAIALVNARIITMDNHGVIENGDILIANGRIQRIGAHGTLRIPSYAKTFDLTGKTIIPGLIDTHNHFRPRPDGPLPMRDWVLAANLAYGVTTAMEPSNDVKSIFTLAELVEAGETLGPRIFSTGPGLLAYKDFPGVDRIDSFEEATDIVQRLARYGARSIKEYQQPRRDLRQKTVEAARKAGLMVTEEGDADPLHILSIAADGHTGFEHVILATPVYRDVTEFLAQAGTNYSITNQSSGFRPTAEQYFYQEMDLWNDRKLRHFIPWRKLLPHTRVRMKRPVTDYSFPLNSQGVADIVAAGGNASMGAHGQTPGIGTQLELWTLASAMKPLEALQIATLGGAKFIGVDGDTGSLREGKFADLVVLDRNPLDDIRNSTTIRYVMKEGFLYSGDTLDEVWPRQRRYGEFYWGPRGFLPATDE